MEYFRLKQDPMYFGTLILPNVINKINRRHINTEHGHQIPEITIFQLGKEDQPEFIDLVDRQLFLISTNLLRTIKLYLPDLVTKTVVIINQAQRSGHTYFLPIFPEIACLADNCILSPDKSVIKHLVLNQPADKSYPPVFRVKDVQETVVIVRLDAAESILRRELRGIKLYRVELSKKEQK